MALHKPVASSVDANNHFGALGAANAGGSLYRDAHGAKYARFGKWTAKGWTWYPKIKRNTPTPHQGTDWPVPIGTWVLSPAKGKVVAHIYTDDRGYHVLVHWKTKAGGQAIACLQHLSHYIAAVGEAVDAGEHVAKSGQSGRGTGPHLHGEIRFTSSATDSWHNWEKWRAVNYERVMPDGDLANSPTFNPA